LRYPGGKGYSRCGCTPAGRDTHGAGYDLERGEKTVKTETIRTEAEITYRLNGEYLANNKITDIRIAPTWPADETKEEYERRCKEEIRAKLTQLAWGTGKALREKWGEGVTATVKQKTKVEVRQQEQAEEVVILDAV
jgi:hypothetical protein